MSTRAPLTQPITKESLRSLGKKQLLPGIISDNPPSERPPSPSISSEYGENVTKNEELRCVIAVMRHGDRTPKQKMKFKVTDSRYLEYFHTYAKGPYKDLKIKSKTALLKFLEVTREIITEVGIPGDLYRQLKQVRDVLGRWEISGFNRKLQMKPQKWSGEPSEEVVVGGETAIIEGNEKVANDGSDIDPLILNNNNTIESTSSNNSSNNTMIRATEVLIILKWGG